jgi:hypothetical protein
MTTLKTLSIVTVLLAGGVSLAIAQGPATGGYPPVAGGAAGNPAVPQPPGPGIIPHDVTNSNMQSAAPPTGAPSGTRIVHRAPHTRLYMQVQHTIPGCIVGQPATMTCACGAAADGGPLLCQTGQWCHYPFTQACTQ